MAASGRRAIDISRIQTKAILFTKGRWFTTLEKDKKNSLPVNFSFNFDDTLFKSSWSLNEQLRITIATTGSPFVDINWQKLRRKATFRLHSLRNRKAVKLILAGQSSHEVQMALGWADLKSLQRYLKISPDAIRTLNSYEKVLSVIHKNKSN